MKRFFKPYFCLTVLAAAALFIYFLNTEPFNLSWHSTILVLLTLLLQYNESTVKNSSISLTTSSYIFLALCFNVYIPIIAYSTFLIALFTKKYKKLFSLRNLKEQKSESMITRVIFNISKQIIVIAVVYFFANSLKINPLDKMDMWKVGVIFIAYYITDALLVTLVMSFSSGIFQANLFNMYDMRSYIFYNFLLSIILTFSYNSTGIEILLLIYMLLFPFQRTALMSIKIETQEKELYTDLLTKTYNVRFFENMLINKLHNKDNFSLIMLDLDKFKYINDTYGHIAGNKALEEFSKIMLKTIVKDNYLCRFGGDEFVVIVNDPADAKEMAKKILETFDNYEIKYNGMSITLSLSIGIYEHNINNHDDLSSILEKVDNAMYRSKKYGGNIIIDYNDK